MYKNSKTKKALILFLFIFCFLATCKKKEENIKKEETIMDSITDSSSLSEVELEQAATNFSSKVIDYLKIHSPNNIIIFTPLTNDTSSQISSGHFDDLFVETLKKNRIFTIVMSNEELTSLYKEEKKIKLPPNANNDFDIGDLKTPNYYILSTADEIFTTDANGDRHYRFTIEFSLKEFNLRETKFSDKVSIKKTRKKVKVNW